jgi:hypothetical protein
VIGLGVSKSLRIRERQAKGAFDDGFKRLRLIQSLFAGRISISIQRVDPHLPALVPDDKLASLERQRGISE